MIMCNMTFDFVMFSPDAWSSIILGSCLLIFFFLRDLGCWCFAYMKHKSLFEALMSYSISFHYLVSCIIYDVCVSAFRRSLTSCSMSSIRCSILYIEFQLVLVVSSESWSRWNRRSLRIEFMWWCCRLYLSICSLSQISRDGSFYKWPGCRTSISW